MIDWKSAAQALAVVAAPLLVCAASVVLAEVGGAAPNPMARSWFGDSAGHAAAARKGWANRRRGYPRSWDEV